MVVADRLPSLYKPHYYSEHPEEDSAPEISPWRKMVKDFRVTVYVHTNRVTESADAGVVAISADIIIARHGARAKGWLIDCVDWGRDVQRTGVIREHDYSALHDLKVSLFRKMILDLQKMGIDPREVRGWTSWVKGFSLSRTLQQLGL